MTPDALADGFEQAAIAEPFLALMAFTVVAVLFVIVKWALPQRARLKEKQLDIERYRIEVQEKADASLDDRERERIKTTQRQIAAQEESTRAIEALGLHTATLSAQLEDSKAHSRQMAPKVESIENTTTHMAKQIDEVHAIVVRRKGVGDAG